MKRHITKLQWVPLALLLVVACAGKSSTSSSNGGAGAGAGGDSGNGGNGGGAGGSMLKLPAPSSHRARGASCAPSPVGPEPVIPDVGVAGTTAFTCAMNEACTLHSGGRWVYNSGDCGEPCIATAPSSACLYDTCAADADCPKASVCVCGQGGPAPNACSVVGNCRVDADCPSGFCSPSVDGCAAFNGYFCHTASDECNVDADCANSGSFARCVVDVSSAAWKCSPVGCASAGTK